MLAALRHRLPPRHGDVTEPNRTDQVGDPATADFSSKEYSGALIQYPNTFGDVINPEEFVEKAHQVSYLFCGWLQLGGAHQQGGRGWGGGWGVSGRFVTTAEEENGWWCVHTHDIFCVS